MKPIAHYSFFFLLFMSMSCSKKDDTATTGSASSTASTASTTATNTTSSTSSSSAQTFSINSIASSKTTAGCQTTPYYCVFYIGTNGESCQMIFTAPPATGSYPTNFSTALQSGQTKSVISKGGTAYLSNDGQIVNVTNNAGKVRVQFTDMSYKADSPAVGTIKASGNFGCD